MTKKARTNRSATPLSIGPGINLHLTPNDIKKGTKRYTDWHWGYEPAKVVDAGLDPADWQTNPMPRVLVECGKLIRLHVRAPRTVASEKVHPRRRYDAMIEFSRNVSNTSHVAYDPSHSHERIYLVAPKQTQNTLKRKLFDNNNMPLMPLHQLASIAGGKHGKKNDYPDVSVKPVGVLTAIVYDTAKEGDGQSYYIHQVGELSHMYPFLCVDEQGRLWLAGGNYSSPNPGITD